MPLKNALNCFQWFSSGCVNMNYFAICSFQIFHKGHAFLVMRGNYKNEGSKEGSGKRFTVSGLLPVDAVCEMVSSQGGSDSLDRSHVV